MSTHINYVQRVANDKGEYPVDKVSLHLGSLEGANPILIMLQPDAESEDPNDLMVTIDSIHEPQDFADFMLTLLHGMAGEVEGVTNTLYTKAVSESGELTEVSPADTDVLDGELVD